MTNNNTKENKALNLSGTSITLINKLTNDLHDRVASINEELIDGNVNQALEEIKSLTSELKHLRSNLLED